MPFKISFFLLLFFSNLLFISCNKVQVNQQEERKIDPFYFGTWQQIRMVEKDSRNSDEPEIKTTYHSAKTPLPRFTFKENGELISVYPNAQYATETIYHDNWGITNNRLYLRDGTDGTVTQQGADSFVKVDVENYYYSSSYYSVQTEWKRVK